MTATLRPPDDAARRSGDALSAWAPAEVGVLAAVLLLAIALRLVNLETGYSGWDEGYYLMVSRLIRTGDRNVFPLPLFFHGLAGVQGLAGDTVWVGRMVIATFSLAGLVATAVCTGALCGRAGALATLLVLAIDPGYLAYSRSVYLEMPAIALAMLATAAVLRFSSGGSRAWLVLGGFLWSLGVFVKLFVLGWGVALLAYPALRRWNDPGLDRVRAILLDWGAIALGAVWPAAHFVWTADLGAFHAGYIAPHRSMAPGIAEHLERAQGLLRFLARDPGMLALALFGAIAGARGSARQSLLPIVLGLLGTSALILQVIHLNHHVVVLIPPLAVLAGVGASRLFEGLRAWPGGRGARPAVQGLLGAAALATYGMSLPGLVRFDGRLLEAPPAPTREAQDSVINTIREATGPQAYVISDQPLLVYRAGRRMPPPITMLTGASILTGGLTAPMLVKAAQDYDVRFVVVSNRSRLLPEWTLWVSSHYHGVGRLVVDNELIELFYKRPRPSKRSPGAGSGPE